MIDHCVVVVSRYLSLAILFCLDMRYPFTCITWFAVFVSFKSIEAEWHSFFIVHIYTCQTLAASVHHLQHFLAELHLGTAYF